MCPESLDLQLSCVTKHWLALEALLFCRHVENALEENLTTFN